MNKRILSQIEILRVTNKFPNIWKFSDKRARFFTFLVREDKKIRGSIHISAYGEIHAFVQNGTRSEVMFWTPRYKWKTSQELTSKFTKLLQKIKQTTRTRI